jgi:hypothetical protein
MSVRSRITVSPWDRFACSSEFKSDETRSYLINTFEPLSG